MTHRTKSWLIVSVISLISMGPFAQRALFQLERRPNFLTGFQTGYWVIERNINSPLDHIIGFYNNDNELLYKETLTGIKLNPERRKVKMKLKKYQNLLCGQGKEDGLFISV